MINEEKSVDFLLKEYSEAYNHMRHYDNLELSFIKFVFTFDIGILSACITIYNYFKGTEKIVVKPLGIISLLGFAVGLIFLSLCVRNRVYFVIVTREVNRIRKYFNENMEGKFNFDEMYMNPLYPKYFNFMSTYSLSKYLIGLLNAILASIGYSLLWCGVLGFNVWVLIISFLVQTGFIIVYLKNKEGKKADEAIHGEKVKVT